jgi:3-dehydroquinate dehydratase/shikimate dehydrogenase
MTLLIASVHGAIPEKLDGADLLEIRIDGMETEECIEQLPSILKASPLPTVLTCRSVDEGGMFEGEEEERFAMYQAALQSDSPPKYIDIEHESLTRHPLLLDLVKTETTGIILSWHDMKGRPPDLLQRAAAMQDIPEVDIVKMVWRARSIRDNLEAFDLLQSRQQPMIAMCMGEYGIMSRVLAPKFGGFATYAAVEGLEPTASGQPTVQELRSKYSFDTIDANTKVYGVIGDNVAHSASPMFHNAAFQAANKNAVYLPLLIPRGWEHLKASLSDLQQYKALDFSGASVTIPHKEEMIKLATSCDEISTTVGATNTITLGHDSIQASNTDVSALLTFFKEASSILILGGGGVARAAIVAAKNCGAKVFIATRRAEQSNSLAKEFCCQVASEETNNIDTVINCTPVGMEGGNAPNGNALLTLAPWFTLTSSTQVIDTVYKPKTTPLLAMAEAAGCPIIHGEEMFRLQAAAQQELWQQT